MNTDGRKLATRGLIGPCIREEGIGRVDEGKRGTHTPRNGFGDPPVIRASSYQRNRRLSTPDRLLGMLVQLETPVEGSSCVELLCLINTTTTVLTPTFPRLLYQRHARTFRDTFILLVPPISPSCIFFLLFVSPLSLGLFFLFVSNKIFPSNSLWKSTWTMSLS